MAMHVNTKVSGCTYAETHDVSGRRPIARRSMSASRFGMLRARSVAYVAARLMTRRTTPRDRIAKNDVINDPRDRPSAAAATTAEQA
jgi:hypothetical protein